MAGFTERHGLPFDPPAGCRFDAAAADAACDFFPRYCRHTEGAWAGKPFELAAWQRDRLIRPVFGWKRADGTRLIRTVYLEVAKKNGKTELCAGLAPLLLLGDGEFGGQGFAGAVDEDQAKIVFHKAGAMVGMSAELGKHLEVFKTSVYCPELMASFKPMSARPGSKHGFSPSFAINDEIHAWPNGDLAQIVRDGMAARAQPLEIYITTAGIKGWGFGWEMHDRALKILDGTLSDSTFLPVIFAADEDDDWRDEATWRKANPNLGISPRLDFMREQAARAAESPRLENNFRRYHLNQWTEQTTRWLSLIAWDKCKGPVPWDRMVELLAGRRCFSAVDLSSKIDVTALVHVFPPSLDGEPWAIVPRLFLPQLTSDEDRKKREERDRQPYGAWAKAGVLHLTPGNVVDYGFIEHQLGEDAKLFDIQEVGFDPWNATQFAQRMAGEGFTMVEMRQGFQTLSEPTKELEKLVLDAKIHHGGHPLLRAMAGAVSVTADPAGNVKPDKSVAILRIDGIVASIMALGRAIVVPLPKKSIYETRGIRFVGAAA